MNIRQAILAAADHIEAHPMNFRFTEPNVPTECGTPGCALGWIGHFGGCAGSYADVAENFLKLPAGEHTQKGHQHDGVGTPYYEFYERMDTCDPDFLGWYGNASKCAATLRRYADKYHPARGIPADVLAIFQTRQSDPDMTIADGANGTVVKVRL